MHNRSLGLAGLLPSTALTDQYAVDQRLTIAACNQRYFRLGLIAIEAAPVLALTATELAFHFRMLTLFAING